MYINISRCIGIVNPLYEIIQDSNKVIKYYYKLIIYKSQEL